MKRFSIHLTVLAFAFAFMPLISTAQDGTTGSGTMPPPPMEGGALPPPQNFPPPGEKQQPPQDWQQGQYPPPDRPMDGRYGEGQYGQRSFGSSSNSMNGQGDPRQNSLGPRENPMLNQKGRPGEMGQQRGPEGGNMGIDQAKQMVRGMERPIAQLKKTLTRLKQQGITVPADAEALVTELSNAIATIKTATEDSDAVEAALDVLQDKGMELGDVGRTLGMLEQLPRVTKDAEKQIKQIRKQLARAQTKAGKNKTDIAAISSKIEASIKEIEAALLSAKSASTADLEDAMENIRDTVFDPLQDLRDDVMILEQISNSSRMIKEAEKEIARVTKLSASLKKQKKDTAELDALLIEMKEKLAEVKSLLTQSDISREDLFDVFSEAERLHNDVMGELAELQGRKNDVEKDFNRAQDPAANLGATIMHAFRNFLSF